MSSSGTTLGLNMCCGESVSEFLPEDAQEEPFGNFLYHICCRGEREKSRELVMLLDFQENLTCKQKSVK